ncbi:MAG: extracellular solute-binding protein [Lachnospiraceae bacterium]|nr:extracellular solute-binding protein [Lachnospiraceae bacterium]
MKKKVIALFLVLAMIVASFAACGKSENGGKANEGGKADSAQGGDTSEEEFSWPVKDGKLSMWLWWSNNYIENPNELVAMQEYEKQTGVHVDYVAVPQAEAQEKFNLMIASGEYPDIIRSAESYYTGGIVQACTDGVTIELTDLVPKYMPNYMKIRNDYPAFAKDTTTDDGRLVGVYTVASDYGEVKGESVWAGLCLRKDWLDELGLQTPETIDEWHTVLKAFKDNYNCEAPLLIGAQNGYDVMGDFISAYGVLGEFYKEGNTVKYGPCEDGYRQWVQLFRDWYAEGLIDPNFISNDASMMNAAGDYIGTGRAGASCNIWGLTADVYKLQGIATDENFFLQGATAPVLNKGDVPQIGFATSEITKETLVVTTNCKDVPLALRWLDNTFDQKNVLLKSLGIEGESVVKDDQGVYHASESLQGMVSSGERTSLSDALFSKYTLGTSDFGLYNWGNFSVLYEGNKAMEAYDYWNKGHFDLMLPACRTLTEEEQNAFNSIYTSIRTLVQENTIKFITGQKPMEEYDSFVADLHTYGIDDCIKYQQAAVDRYNAR